MRLTHSRRPEQQDIVCIGTVAFITCHVTLRGQKLRQGYPEEIRTVGDHLKRTRLDRGLGKYETARLLGASVGSLTN
jgi:hypothetical protein